MTEEGNGKKKVFEFNYFPMALDYVLRWILLGLWRIEKISDIWFWLINIALIPILVLIVLSKLERKAGYDSDKDEVKGTGLSILFTVFILGSGLYITWHLYENLHTFFKFAIFIAVFVAYGFYLIVLHVSSPKVLKLKKPNFNDDYNVHINASPEDSNDIDITGLESTLHYMNDRVNSYILESALFSGLAFAGFITLITSDRINISHISKYIESTNHLMASLMYFKIDKFFNVLEEFSNTDLFITILIQSLICTLAFVSVIASRLRFSDILEEVDFSVRAAKVYNDKEEEVFLLNLESPQPQLEKKIRDLNKSINQEVIIAEQKLQRMRPLLNYMRFLRTLGILFFIMMVITSASIISELLAIVILALSILITIFMNIDHNVRIKQIKSLNIQQGRLFNKSRSARRRKKVS